MFRFDESLPNIIFMNNTQRNKHTEKLEKSRGFTLVEIMIVVLIIGILMAIAVPNFVQARSSSRRSTCVASLKKIDASKEQCAMDNKMNSGDAVTTAQLVPTYLRVMPACPGGGTYTLNAIGTSPSCSLAAAPNLHVLPY